MSYEHQQMCRFYPHCAIHIGEPTKGALITRGEEAEMIKQYQAGVSIYKIAETMGRHWMTVRRRVMGEG